MLSGIPSLLPRGNSFSPQLQVEYCSYGQVDRRGRFLGVLRKIKRCAYEVSIVHLEHIKLCPDVWRYVTYFYGLAPQTEWVYVTAMAEWHRGCKCPLLTAIVSLAACLCLLQRKNIVLEVVTLSGHQCTLVTHLQID